MGAALVAAGPLLARTRLDVVDVPAPEPMLGKFDRFTLCNTPGRGFFLVRPETFRNDAGSALVKQMIMEHWPHVRAVDENWKERPDVDLHAFIHSLGLQVPVRTEMTFVRRLD